MPKVQIVDNFPIRTGEGSGLPKDVFVNARFVESSNVEWIAWPVTGEPLLIVKYKHGGVYGYLGVSRQKSVAAANAPSVGSYIHSRIKGKYRPVRIENL